MTRTRFAALVAAVAVSGCTVKVQPPPITLPHILTPRKPPPVPELPPWTDAMSDGCSAPKLIKPTVDKWHVFTPKETACCVVHDKAYYYGGSYEARLAADRMLRACFVKASGSTLFAEGVFLAVRGGGGPEGMQPYSWDNGEGLAVGVWRYRP